MTCRRWHMFQRKFKKWLPFLKAQDHASS